MTKRELIDAFIRGEVDRRQFVSRLTMLGVSSGAAVAYAASLAPSAAAAPAQTGSGFIMRAQDDNAQGEDGDAQGDEEYGTVIELPTDEEGVALALAAIEAVQGILGALDDFADELADNVRETLSTVRAQQAQHRDALQALIGGATGTSAGTPPNFANAGQFTKGLSTALESLSSLYAAVVPAFQAGEFRQTTMQVASIAARHAAHTRQFANLDLLPEAFQKAEVPADLQSGS